MELRVITGGQSGVDQAALRAARAVGFETGGLAAFGWETENGPAPWLADFGLIECPETGYRARRRRNVTDAETMLQIGDPKSPGSIGLLEDWRTIGKSRPYCWVEPGVSTPREVVGFLRGVRFDHRRVRVVMVAGNRQSKCPGIGERAERFLLAVFKKLASG